MRQNSAKTAGKGLKAKRKKEERRLKVEWYPEPESNRHGRNVRGILSPLCLPISPPGHFTYFNRHNQLSYIGNVAKFYHSYAQTKHFGFKSNNDSQKIA